MAKDEPEKIVLAGKQSDIPAMLTALLANSQIMREKDLGQFVGESIADIAKARQTVEPLHMTVFWSDKKDRINPYGVRPYFKVPFLRRNVTWEEIRIAAGGQNGYQWGRWLASGTITHENLSRPVKAYGSSAASAKSRLEAMLTLSKGTLISATSGQEEKIGEKADGRPLQKQTTTIYPIYFSIVNPQRIAKKIKTDLTKQEGRKGRATLTGESYNFKSNKFWLHYDKEPGYYAEQMRELLKLTDED